MAWNSLRHLNVDFVPFQDLHQRTFEILVQCTPLGMEGTASAEALPGFPLSSQMVVMDLVYRPYWTPFLKRARDAGCQVVSGLDMLLYQGVAQFEWWLGQLRTGCGYERSPMDGPCQEKR